jgi:hypothetical protein
MESSDFDLSTDICWTRFFDLSGGDLEVADKLFVCEKFEQQQKEPNGLSMRAFCAIHKIAKTTFYDWYNKYLQFRENGILKMGKKRGRPPLIDEKGLKDL